MEIIKPNSINPGTGANRARILYRDLGICELCFKPACDRHHKDGNEFHNSKDNIMFLCRIHHMEIDGRLNKFKLLPKKPKLQITKKCKVCGIMSFPLRKGKCHVCNEYYRRNGNNRPRMFIERRIISPCNECGDLFEADSFRSKYCGFCKSIVKRNRHAYYEMERRKIPRIGKGL
jgi:ribosomal protein L37E